MSIATRKLRIIEKLIVLTPSKISQIESLLFEKNSKNDRDKILSELSGAWKEDEADYIKSVIENRIFHEKPT